jgi:SAM-dependent methyltransferase
LIPAGAAKQVSFLFSGTRSTRSADFERVLRYPPQRGLLGGKAPYHLDRSHDAILAAQTAGSTVLEVGCGGGQMRSHVEARGLRYIGTDISKTRVHSHLQAYGGPDVLCDAHFLPFRDESVECVFSVSVMEHLACPHLAAHEILRVLKPGGCYMGSVSFLEPWHDDSFFHLSPLGIFEVLTTAGFSIAYLWPGQATYGVSGFRALCDMGNTATVPLSFVGDFLYTVFRTGYRVRDLITHRRLLSLAEHVADDAKITRAFGWIAYRA